MASRDPTVDIDEQRDVFSTPGPYTIDHPSSETSNASAHPESDQVLHVRRKPKKRSKSKSRSDGSRRVLESHARVEHTLEERAPSQPLAAGTTQQAPSQRETRLSKSPGENRRIARQNNEISTDEITNKDEDEEPLIPNPKPQSRPAAHPVPQPPRPPPHQAEVPDMPTLKKTFYLVPTRCIKHPRTCYCCYGVALVLALSVFLTFSIPVAVWGAHTQAALDSNTTITVSAQEVSILQPTDYGRFYKQICFNPSNEDEAFSFGATDCSAIRYNRLSLPKVDGPYVTNATDDTKYSQLFFYWMENTTFTLDLSTNASSEVKFYILEDLGSRNNLDGACESLAQRGNHPEDGVRTISHTLPVNPPVIDPYISISCHDHDDSAFNCSIMYNTSIGIDTHYSLCFIYKMDQTIRYSFTVESGKAVNLSSIPEHNMKDISDCDSSPGGCCLPYKGFIFRELANPTCVIIHTNDSDHNPFERSYNLEISRLIVRPDFSLIAGVIGLAFLICFLPTLWYVIVKRKVDDPDLEGCQNKHWNCECCVRVELQCRQYPPQEYRPLR